MSSGLSVQSSISDSSISSKLRQPHLNLQRLLFLAVSASTSFSKASVSENVNDLFRLTWFWQGLVLASHKSLVFLWQALKNHLYNAMMSNSSFTHQFWQEAVRLLFPFLQIGNRKSQILQTFRAPLVRHRDLRGLDCVLYVGTVPILVLKVWITPLNHWNRFLLDNFELI